MKFAWTEVKSKQGRTILSAALGIEGKLCLLNCDFVSSFNPFNLNPTVHTHPHNFSQLKWPNPHTNQCYDHTCNFNPLELIRLLMSISSFWVASQVGWLPSWTCLVFLMAWPVDDLFDCYFHMWDRVFSVLDSIWIKGGWLRWRMVSWGFLVGDSTWIPSLVGPWWSKSRPCLLSRPSDEWVGRMRFSCIWSD